REAGRYMISWPPTSDLRTGVWQNNSDAFERTTVGLCPASRAEPVRQRNQAHHVRVLQVAYPDGRPSGGLLLSFGAEENGLEAGSRAGHDAGAGDVGRRTGTASAS